MPTREHRLQTLVPAAYREPLPAISALLPLLSRARYAAFLDSNEAPDRHWDWLIALGAKEIYEAPSGQALAGLRAFRDAVTVQNGTPPWLFGHLAYDLKNEWIQPERAVGQLQSRLQDAVGFPDCCWFVPQYAVGCRQGQVYLLAGDGWPPADWQEDANGTAAIPEPTLSDQESAAAESGHGAAKALAVRPAAEDQPSRWHCDLPEHEHAAGVEALRQHIRAGDVYEVNLCAQFQAMLPGLEPVAAFHALNAAARAPFSAYYRVADLHLLCASPERFLEKRGAQLRSQPIKGTAARGLTPEADLALAAALQASEKDRAENVMIVDLVRNDLAAICKTGSIAVPELCGVHHFPTVHHLISTVTGTLKDGFDFGDAWQATFPMGSMTGAPKIMALELIERYERSRRGLYSGSIGYLSPVGDFDLNVVIRSLLYDAASAQASLPAGGAITWDSRPAAEWAELHVKAAAVRAAVDATLAG